MSLFYDKDEYELAQSTDTDTLLAELPFDLIRANITSQIQDPASDRTNYIDIVVDKCNLYKEDYSDNQELVSELDDKLTEFFTFIMSSINDRFDLGLDVNSIAADKEAVDIGTSIYKYFILRYQTNITKFIRKYIFENKDYICRNYITTDKKDVSTLAHKKNVKNPTDLCILTNLSSIIKDIVYEDISSTDFLKLSAKKDHYDASIIRDLIKSGQMIGNFYSSYIKLCVDDHDYILDDILTDVRDSILSKLNK